jgi:hypothetical protein
MTAAGETIRIVAQGRIVQTALYCLLFAAAVFMFAFTNTEALWEHVNCGLQFLRAGSPVTTVDPWSYMTSGTPWIDYNWLFETGLALAYRTAGSAGIVLFKLAFVFLLLAILFAHILRGVRSPLAVSLFFTFTMLTLGPFLVSARPHLATAVLFAILLSAMKAADQSAAGRRWLWAAPALIAVWCNLHGGFVSGLLTLLVWCLCDSFDVMAREKTLTAAARPRVSQNLFVAGGSILAVLANPYGVALPKLLLHALSLPRPEFADWHPISIESLVGVEYFVWLALVVAACLTRKPRISIASMCVLAITLLQPFSAVRHLMLAVIAIVVFCSDSFGDWARSWAKNDAIIALEGNAAIAGLLSLLSLIMVSCAVPKIGQIMLPPDLPVRAVDVLSASGVSGNLATLFDYGDYCIWHLYPCIKVAIDGRREAAYSDEALSMNMKFTYGVGDWDAILTKHPTNLVLAGKNYATYALMRLRPGWQLCYEDELCAIFAPVGSREAESIIAASQKQLADHRYFP